jgi:O-antigen ligase
LIALIPLSAAPYGAVEPWWTAIVGAAVFLLAALSSIEGAISGSWFRRVHVVLLPWLGLAGFAFVQSLPIFDGQPISFDPFETRLAALRVLVVTVYAALLLRYTCNERRLRALVYALVLTGLLCALFGIARQTGQRDLMGFLFLPLLRRGSGFAQFINKNHFAYVAEMSLGLLMGIVAGYGIARQRMLIWTAVAIPVWVALVLCGSRGGLFAMLCQVIFIAATFGITRASGENSRSTLARMTRSRVAHFGLAGALVVAVFVGAIWVGGDPLAERMESVRDEIGAGAHDSAAASRSAIWRDTWTLVESHPFAGVGLGGYWIAIRGTHQGAGALVPLQAHNDYLELLASTGAVGALLLISFLFLMIWHVRVRLRSGSAFARAATLGALAGLFGVAVHSLVEFGLHITSNALMFAALLSVAVAQISSEESEDTAKDEQKTNLSAY